MNRTRTARRSGAGFTLIELMVSVAIIALLAAIAYPAYTSYLKKSNRAAAQSYMIELAQAQSQYLADTRSYAPDESTLHMTTPTAVASKYQIQIAATNGAPPTFTITATPLTTSSQAGEDVLTLDQAGARAPASKW